MTDTWHLPAQPPLTNIEQRNCIQLVLEWAISSSHFLFTTRWVSLGWRERGNMWQWCMESWFHDKQPAKPPRRVLPNSCSCELDDGTFSCSSCLLTRHQGTEFPSLNPTLLPAFQILYATSFGCKISLEGKESSPNSVSTHVQSSIEKTGNPLRISRRICNTHGTWKDELLWRSDSTSGWIKPVLPCGWTSH